MEYCQFCGQPAEYDGKTKMGPWAYMCAFCWRRYGVGRLGVGCGQRIEREDREILPNEVRNVGGEPWRSDQL